MQLAYSTQSLAPRPHQTRGVRTSIHFFQQIGMDVDLSECSYPNRLKTNPFELWKIENLSLYNKTRQPKKEIQRSVISK